MVKLDQGVVTMAQLLAQHFAYRPWAQMAENRTELRARIRDGDAAARFDINEPTREDCMEAAEAVIALGRK